MIKIGTKDLLNWYADEHCDGDLRRASSHLASMAATMTAHRYVHDGDCTKRSQPCLVCGLQEVLDRFEEYTFGRTRFDVMEDALRAVIAADDLEIASMEKHDDASPGDRDSWDAYQKDSTACVMSMQDAVEQCREATKFAPRRRASMVMSLDMPPWTSAGGYSCSNCATAVEKHHRFCHCCAASFSAQA